MKYSIYTYLLLVCGAFSLLSSLSSCSDDNFVNEEVILEESDPDTLSYTFVTGIVKDSEGNTLPNITIEYLIDGEVKSVTTNEEGIYEIRQFDKSVKRATIKCQGMGFLSKVEVIHINDLQIVENDIILAHENQFEGTLSGDIASQSLTDSLLSVTGRLVNSDGDGVPNVYVYFVDFTFSTFIYAITDADGSFTLATDPVEDVVLLAGSQCQSIETLIEVLEVDQDVELGDVTTSIIETTLVTFSGFITDCYTQEGLISGEVRLQFEGNTLIKTADITNGEYSIDVPLCTDSECVDVTIFSYLSQSGIDTLPCQDFVFGANVIDFEVCNDEVQPSENGGTLTYTIGGVTTTYPLVEVEETDFNYSLVAADLESLQAFVLITEGKEIAGTTQTVGIIDITTTNATYASGPGEMSYQIDSTDATFMYGTFGGEILNGSTGNTELIDGSFKAEIK